MWFLIIVKTDAADTNICMNATLSTIAGVATEREFQRVFLLHHTKKIMPNDNFTKFMFSVFIAHIIPCAHCTAH